MSGRDSGVTDGSVRRRLAQLEREQDRQAKLLTEATRRAAVNHYPVVRLAVTVADTNDTPDYPLPPANCFKIAFADSKFTRTVGSQTLTTTKRNSTSASYQDWARTINGLWVPEETLVAVLDTPAYASGDGHWFIIGAYPVKPLVRFTLAAALATTDASKTATITHQFGFGVASTYTGAAAITVHNLETHTAGTYVFFGSSGDAGYAFLDVDDDYRIIQMECP